MSEPDFFRISRRLQRKYGDFSHYNKKNPLRELIFIICSTKTSEKGYIQTYSEFTRSFPNFDSLSSASVSSLARPLEKGGLSKKKASQLRLIFDRIIDELGSLTLSPLKKLSADDCEQFLVSLPGVGKKIARCVMLYSLGHEVFPVDVHCWRICQRIGWVSPTIRDGRCTERDMDRLQQMIPSKYRFSLHVNMISLGRELCLPKGPHCEACPIGSDCEYFRENSSRERS